MTKELEERVTTLEQTVADLTELCRRLRASAFPYDADLVEAREERKHRVELERRLDEIPRDGKGNALWEPFSSIDEGLRRHNDPRAQRRAFVELTIPTGLRIKDYPTDWNEDLDKVEKWGFRHGKPTYYASGGGFINTQTGEEAKPRKPEEAKPRHQVVEEVDGWDIN